MNPNLSITSRNGLMATIGVRETISGFDNRCSMIGDGIRAGRISIRDLALDIRHPLPPPAAVDAVYSE